MRGERFVLTFLVVACSGLLLHGCPYESERPLGSSAEAKIDEALLGRWEERKESGELLGTATILPFNDHEMVIVLRESGKEDPELMRAFVTIIDGERFLNVQEVSSKPGKRAWYLANYRVSGDRLEWRIVEETLFTKAFESSPDLHGFVKENLRNPELYSEDPKQTMSRAHPTFP
jgi:hypothetical protein